jgi:DNA helicase-2/ATP-dependent DNA helicase PcrA
MEEGIFPGYRSTIEESEMEEERRLCYVGITRAKEILYMTGAHSRTIFGSTTFNRPSRFIEEIPSELIEGYEEANRNKKDKLKSWDYEGSGSRSADSYNKTNTYAAAFLKPAGVASTVESGKNIDLSQFKTGMSVEHKKFGFGVITKIEPEGNDLKLDIAFKQAGMKRLMAQYAGLKIIQNL